MRRTTPEPGTSSADPGDERPVVPAADEVLDRLPVAVVLGDTRLRCRYANAAAVRWIGLAGREEVLGRAFRDLLPAEVYAAHLPHARAALAGVPQRFSRSFLDRRGAPRQADVSYLPQVEDGEVVGFLLQVADSTERTHADAELHRRSVSAAVTGERDRIATGVTALIGRRIHGAALELSAALQPGAEAVEDRLRAALLELDAAVHEARRLVHPGTVQGEHPEPDPDDRELRRTRVLLGQLQTQHAERAARHGLPRPRAGRPAPP